MKKILLILLLLVSVPEMAFAYYVWHPCCNSCNRLGGWWASADYLLMWRKKRFYPPLVTSNPLVPPILGAPGTEILFGDESLGRSPKPGYRVDAGLWWNCCCGFGAGIYQVDQEKIKFRTGGNDLGHPFIGLPFFNEATGLQAVDLISAPDPLIVGFVEIEAVNRNMGADAYLRYHFVQECGVLVDLLGGFYYNQLVDNLKIRSQKRVPQVELPSIVIRVEDQFNCSNNFYGAFIGSIAEFYCDRWALRATCKVAFGDMYKKVNIKGLTDTFSGADLGTIHTEEVGFLANRSNIGRHNFNKFTVIPELEASLRYRLCGRLWVTVGYTCIYWPSVLLAGEQIDLRLNAANPKFHHKDKSFWEQGATAGLYIYF